MAHTTYRVAFLMEQVAGHATNYHNLRSAAEEDRDLGLIPTWHEVTYHRSGGVLETLGERYPRFVPGYVSGNLRAATDFRQGLHGGSYDALLTNSWAAMLFPRKLMRTPTVIDFDSTPVQIDAMPEYSSPRDPAPVAKAKWHLTRRMYHAARVLQAWSHWAKQSVVADYGISESKIVVNPPGVDLTFWQPHHRPGWSEGPARVLFVGGDFSRKGGELLLQWLRSQPPGTVELHVVTRDDVVPRPGLTVHHHIAPNSNELRRLYQSADLFALPSLAECFGLATLEAMASGLPVVVSDVGGTGDIVDHGANGFITRSGDLPRLCAALDALVHDRTLREAMGRRSRQLAEQRFDVRTNARRTLTLLREVAGGEIPSSRL